MSRSVRFVPLAVLLILIAGLIWRLATPVDTNVHSRLVRWYQDEPHVGVASQRFVDADCRDDLLRLGMSRPFFNRLIEGVIGRKDLQLRENGVCFGRVKLHRLRNRGRSRLASRSEKPITAFRGVRNSWLILARKLLLARLAISASSFCAAYISLSRSRSTAWRAICSLASINAASVRAFSGLKRCAVREGRRTTKPCTSVRRIRGMWSPNRRRYSSMRR